MSDSENFGSGSRPQMEHLSDLPVRKWTATAVARVKMKPETLVSIVFGQIAGGDVLSVAAVGGVLGAKQTAVIVPVRQPRAITQAKVEFGIDSLRSAIDIVARVGSVGAGTVATEALSAAFAAALTIFDLCRSVDDQIAIEYVRLSEVTGREHQATKIEPALKAPELAGELAYQAPAEPSQPPLGPEQPAAELPGQLLDLVPATGETQVLPRLRLIAPGEPVLKLPKLKSKLKSKAKPKAKRKTKPKAKPKSKAGSKAKPKAKAGAKPKTKRKVKPKAKPKSKAGSKSKPKAKARPKAKAKPKPKAKVRSKSRPKAKAKPKARAKVKPKSPGKSRRKTKRSAN